MNVANIIEKQVLEVEIEEVLYEDDTLEPGDVEAIANWYYGNIIQFVHKKSWGHKDSGTLCYGGNQGAEP